MPGTVTRIAYAVVKGLRLNEVDRVQIGPDGIAGDRRFHLADERGTMLNGKRRGVLVQVGADWDAETDVLTLTLPGGEQLSAPVALGDSTSTRFYGAQRPGRIVEGPWAAALADLAGRHVALVQADHPAEGLDRAEWGPVTVLGTASVDALSASAGGAPLDVRRFRMTVGFDGLDAHAEEAWLGGTVRVGEALLEPTMGVARCLVTSQDPVSGVADRDVLGLLRDYRPLAMDQALPLGIAARVLEPGSVAVGDPIGPG